MSEMSHCGLSETAGRKSFNGVGVIAMDRLFVFSGGAGARIAG
jgi:hypothetical protein